MFILRFYELFAGNAFDQLANNWIFYVYGAIVADVIFFLFFSSCLLLISSIIWLFSERAAVIVQTISCIVAVIGQAMLVGYYLTALNPLGADLFQYNLAEIKLTIGAAISLKMIIVYVLSLVVVAVFFIYLPRIVRLPKAITTIFLFGSLFVFLFVGIEPKSIPGPKGMTDFWENLQRNKSAYFYKNSFYYLTGIKAPQELPLYADDFVNSCVWAQNDRSSSGLFYPDKENYPFLHSVDYPDMLSDRFRISEKAPDIVIIIIEGLGRAFSGTDAYLGSFTPFIDSLANQSLYWENCLSSGGRTFAVLPSLTASLPFGENGFAELGDNMPKYLGLVNILRSNGYRGRFIYAGDSHFDNMDDFMRKQQTDVVTDQADFDRGVSKLPGQASGFSWGYGDSELYKRFFDLLSNERNMSPSVNILLTISTHSPFLVPNQERYKRIFDQILLNLKIEEGLKKVCSENRQKLETVLYMDEAMKAFFSEYRNLPSFENTIFLITGDHRMPDIPMSTKIDRYHVPLIVYSPLLKRPSRFSSIVSHMDVTPSLLAFMKNSYNFSVPSHACWIGSGLDSTISFSGRGTYPLMQTKEGINDLVSCRMFLCQGTLYSIIPGMGLEEVSPSALRDNLDADLKKIKELNSRVPGLKSLYPDSLLSRFYK